jgi:hypothetical protein
MGSCYKCQTQITLQEEEGRCECGVYKKGKYEGFNYITKLKISNKDTCQLYRGSFNKNDNN